MTPPWAFMDGMGLAHRRAAGAGHTRPGGFSRGWAVTGGFRGVGDAAPYVGGRPLTGGRANLRRGAVRRLFFFFFNIGLPIRLKMYPRCRAWTFDNRLHPTLFSVRLHLCF